MRTMFAAVLAVFLCLPANAQQIQCFPYDAFVERFSAMGGQLTAAGVDSEGRLVQVLTSSSGQWIVFVHLEREGVAFACPFTAGEGWEYHQPVWGEES